MANYIEVKKEDVIETLAAGAEVFLCDFPTMRMMKCSDLNMSAIKSFIEKDGAQFYKAVEIDG